MGPGNRIQKILATYRVRLVALLGDHLESMVLYGSQARGDAEEGSDIDVLCVLKGPFDYGDMIQRTSEVTAETSLEYEVVLSRTFVTRDEYISKKTPFLMSVRREGVVL